MGTRINWLQNGSYTAETDRLLISSLLASNGGFLARSGVLAGGGELAVTAQSTPNMTVAIATGQCAVQGTLTSTQGIYVVTVDSNFNLTVATANATNPRIDLVCVVVQDSGYAGTTDAASVQIITGTAAPTPTAPAAPSNSYALAQINVPAGATSITNAVIADLRQRTTARGGIIPAMSTSLPFYVSAGQVAYATDTGNLMVWNGSAWTTLASISAGTWNSYTPTWTASTTNPALGNGTLTARWTKVGKAVTYMGTLICGSTTNGGTGLWNMSLPVPAANNGVQQIGVADYVNIGDNEYVGLCEIPVGVSTLGFVAKGQNSYFYNNISNTQPVSTSSSSRLHWNITYEAA